MRGAGRTVLNKNNWIIFFFAWRLCRFRLVFYSKTFQIFRYANINQVFYDANGDSLRCKGKECNKVEYNVLQFNNGEHCKPFDKVLFGIVWLKLNQGFVVCSGVAGRLVKSEREATWLEADKLTEVQVIIHFCQGRIINRTKRWWGSQILSTRWFQKEGKAQ